MAFSLRLARQLTKAGWKVKIRDKERLEEPHITIINGTDAWRIGLRSRAFLDDGRWKDFPDDLRVTLEANWERMCREWDAIYPNNRVEGDDDDGNDEE
jgi:hypothetical protein